MPAFAALALAAFVSTLVMRMTDPVVPAIARDLGVEPARVALLATAYALPYGLFQLVFGPLGDRFGKLRIVRLAVVALAFGILATALAPTYGTMMAARAISGAIGGAIIPLGIASVGDRVAAPERPAALARFMVFVIIGTISGAFLTGLLAEILPWRTIFAGYAGLCLAIGAALFFVPRQNRTADVDLSPAGLWRRYAGILSRPAARLLIPVVFLEGALIFAIIPYVAPYLHDLRGMGFAETGLVIASFGTGGAVFSLVVSHLLRLLGPKRVVAVGGAVTGVAAMLFALALPLPGYVGLWLVGGLGFYMLHNNLQNRATELAPEARGSAIALFAFAFFVGQGIGPALAGLVAAGFGYQTMIVTIGVLLVVFAIVVQALLIRADARAGEPG